MTDPEPRADADSATPELGPGHAGEPVAGRALAVLGLTALGVVYGDIGTSPLYAVRECFLGPSPVPPTAENVLGVLSLIFWSLLVVISVKYVSYVLRADNNGEGGILALMALLDPWKKEGGDRRVVIALGLFGAALLYGDGMITPAISVLSAIEGLEVAAPDLGRAVLPLTIAVLVALFAFQRRGTERVGRVFGPVMLVWFAVLAVLGIRGIAHRPEVLAAVSPHHAVRFFFTNGLTGYLVLGAVFLVVTGGEALYADLGHFGNRPIRYAWFGVVLPGLLLNYFGQGALLLAHPTETTQPFYHLAPAWALYPLVGLATVATVIASQAVISGAFSLTRQAVQLGLSPRLTIEQTSAEEIGQIYIPAVNWTLMLATIALVLGFGSSSRLAAAYGVAVVTTMVITTLLAYSVTRERWGWGRPAALAVTAGFFTVDVAFFGANVDKIPDGGWFPLVVAAAVFAVMSTWSRGRRILAERLRRRQRPLADLLDDLEAHPPVRVPGTAVVMTGHRETPPMLVHHLEHNQVLHEQVVLLTVLTERVPRVPPSERVGVTELRPGIFRVLVHYGFMESPNVPAALRSCKRFGLDLDIEKVSFYLGRETLIARPGDEGMAMWRERLFAFMARNAARATAFYRLPPDRVVELGQQVEL